jgi:hypothetical protein
MCPSHSLVSQFYYMVLKPYNKALNPDFNAQEIMGCWDIIPQPHFI